MKVSDLVAHLPVGPYTAAEARELDKLEAELKLKGIESVDDIQNYMREITLQANREMRQNLHFSNRVEDEVRHGKDKTLLLKFQRNVDSSDARLEMFNHLENQLMDLIHRKSQE